MQGIYRAVGALCFVSVGDDNYDLQLTATRFDHDDIEERRWTTPLLEHGGVLSRRSRDSETRVVNDVQRL